MFICCFLFYWIEFSLYNIFCIVLCYMPSKFFSINLHYKLHILLNGFYVKTFAKVEWSIWMFKYDHCHRIKGDLINSICTIKLEIQKQMVFLVWKQAERHPPLPKINSNIYVKDHLAGISEYQTCNKNNSYCTESHVSGWMTTTFLRSYAQLV